MQLLWRGGFLKICLTLCPWREHQLHAGEGAGRCGPGCSRRPGGGASTVREDILLADIDRWLVYCVLPSMATGASGWLGPEAMCYGRLCSVSCRWMADMMMQGQWSLWGKSSDKIHLLSLLCLTWVSDDKQLQPHYSSTSTSIWQSQQNKIFFLGLRGLKFKLYVVRWQERIASATVRLLKSKWRGRNYGWVMITGSKSIRQPGSH